MAKIVQTDELYVTSDVRESSLRPAYVGQNYAISATHYFATLAGFRVLERGGNAIDAGVAAGITLGVVEPYLTSFSGVAPIMIHLADRGETVTISGLGRWPRAANIEYFERHFGGDMPVSIHQSVVPAAPDAWITALEQYGTISFAEAAATAIELAERGFGVYPRLAAAFAGIADQIRAWPSSAAVFMPGGQMPGVRELFVQKDLANTLKFLVAAEADAAKHGRQAGLQAARREFYEGRPAQLIDQFSRELDGFIRASDLAEFRVKIEPPVKTRYKEYEVYACGPWCQGPALLQALNLVERVDLKALGHNSAEYLHTLVEAIKLAMADRDRYYGDPDFVRVPMNGLLAKEYAADRLGLIDAARAHPEMPPAGDPWRYEGSEPIAAGYRRPEPVDAPPEPDTSYVCVVDRWGNAFSATPSDSGTSSPIVPGLGMIISSRGRQSWLDRSHTSVLEPWKRPRLTPNPALALRDGKVFMPFGCPGGDAQTQAMLQVFLNVVEFDMDPQTAIEQPRAVSQSFPNSFWPHRYRPGILNVESGVPERVRDALAAKGHVVEPWPMFVQAACGVCTIVAEPEQGVLIGGADPRRESYALGW
ncbi:MAG: gamma-glutamyltransferase family protein [Chloroflexi bacterium]|nr:gamma-glutamyltransferase family protein [Chloroflexota bacterium]